MSGKKGRSGRKPLLEEQSVEDITNLSADILLRWLQNEKVPTAKKVQVCRDIVLKRLPTKVEGKGISPIVFATITRIIENASDNRENKTAESPASPETLAR